MRRINYKVILRFPFVGLDGSNYGAIGTIVVGNGFELGTTANLQIVSKDFD